jgi:PAB-dependent poly(A)-specific ribonuclease subunit 2
MLVVALTSPDPEASDEWHLFNDFLVTQCSTAEALRFDSNWKLPSVLCYQLKSLSHAIDNSWKHTLDTSILYKKWSAAQSEHLDQFRLLNPNDEQPLPGTQVGIDAEFVALQREEIEIKADGTRETIRPSRLGLARVSVLRGDGPDTDLPFIDDYIAVTEPVVDYLTQHSGISPGDLDRQTSSYILVSLKVAYKKLWLLLNLGCIFVGHGLIKDFRTINIHVPKAQVIDTVDLFYIKARQRKLSLRFLAWLLLKEDIQAETHDSIEDARTALKLWRKYRAYKEEGEGVLEEKLEWIYRRGAETRFKAPDGKTSGGEETLGVPAGMLTSGRSTPGGRTTPEMGVRGEEGVTGAGVSPMRSEAGTPVRRGGFGVGRGGFGSPMR